MQSDLDAATDVKLTEFLMSDLDWAIANIVLGAFVEIPNIYTKLFPPAAVAQHSAGGLRIKKGKLTQLSAVAAAATAAVKGGKESSTTTEIL